MKLNGTGVSPGIAVGPVMTLKSSSASYMKECKDTTGEEIQKLHRAIEKSICELNKLFRKTLKKSGKKEASLLEAQIMMLKDTDFIEKIEDEIKTNKINGEWAVENVRDDYVSIFESMDNEFLKERALDIREIAHRIVKNMQEHPAHKFHTTGKYIVAAYDLTEADIALLNIEKAMGLLVEQSMENAYIVTCSQSLGIPAVVGIQGLMDKVQKADSVAFDGETGEVLVNPTEEELEKIIKKKTILEEEEKKREKWIGQKSLTLDGHYLPIRADISSMNDLQVALKNDAEGIGLFRTEWIFDGREEPPSEEEQFEIYNSAVNQMGDKPLTIRTVDCSSDKTLGFINLANEENPYLGCRGIRVYRERPELFKAQLRAILRAGPSSNVRVLLPMVSTLEELREAKNLLEQAKNELKGEAVTYNDSLKIGVMIETPSAALMSDCLSREVDFFVLGTNQLIQFVMAYDKHNSQVAYLCSFYQPAFLRLVNRTIENAHKAGIQVGMFGDAVKECALMPLWIGMGIDELYMSAKSVLKAREAIRSISYEENSKLIASVMRLPTESDVLNFIKHLYI